MYSEVDKFTRSGFISLVLLIMILSYWGCASRSASKGAEPNKNITIKNIRDISVSSENGLEKVKIEGDSLLDYTSIKQPFPISVVLYFPETDIGLSETELEPDGELVNSITISQLSEQEHTSRVEILMKKDVPYEVVREGNFLNIIFLENEENVLPESDIKSTVMEAEQVSKVEDNEKEEPLYEALNVGSVVASKLEDGVQINIQGDGQIEKYDAFVLKDPARIVFDILDVLSPFKKEQTIEIGEDWVEKVRYCSHPNKVRIVIDTKEKYLSKYKATAVKKGLVIKIGDISESTDEDISIATSENINSTDSKESKIVTDINDTKVNNLDPVWINRIEFIGEEEGKSSILIGATNPINFDVSKTTENQIQLTLVNAKLPKHRQRPLITTRFESAVDRIIPVSSPSDPNNSLVILELRESVPYFIEQEGNMLHVRFEASTVPPKPVEEANLPSWKSVLDEASTDIDTESIPEPVVAISQTDNAIIETVSPSDVAIEQEELPSIDSEITEDVQDKKSYIGKKISLDFYKTDIQNVFRILRDVSGKNFAVDKDVTGTVTLTLEREVPWDQVLDLVLKMNQLGKTNEGDIIRIATLATLKEEEKLRQEALKARQDSQDQEKALVPVVTEYIPINYSNADTDIKPHLDMILTKDRGSISIDTRTNQIIMVDVPDKIKLAKDIVKKLDKVTPQVIIEARIVEASTTFARELGTEWSASSEDVYNSDIKGYYGFGIAMNNPTSSATSSLGFTFEKVSGTNFLLDAKLEAMESQNEGKIVSSPKIVTLDNNKAIIKQGVEYPYSVVDDGDVSIEFKPIDLLLEVTPHVTSDNRISINIKITKNDIYEETSPPALTTKEVETELLINDGDTIVIGGIIKTTKRDLYEGFPILSKLPLVGWLFKVSRINDEKEELLIFLTPSIVQLEQPHV